ncbi:MAG TPA: cytochrome c biogenesis protein CcdA [Nitrospira sp.]|nr:cytochrome c biogenesis protein CcdA [Nitrospira sp.]
MAALAGLLSFLSPCVLPLVPAYVFYLTGRTFLKTRADRSA